MERSNSELLDEITQRECQYDIYSVLIKDIPVYGFVSRHFKLEYLKRFGYPELQSNRPISTMNKVRSVLVSFGSSLKFWLFGKRCSNCFYTFRLEKVADIYIDKFFDPIIENSSIGEDYIILEKISGREAGSKRIHSENVHPIDYILFNALWVSRLMYPLYSVRYRNEFDLLYEKLQLVFPGIKCDLKLLKRIILYESIKTNLFARLLKRVRCDNFIAASRGNFSTLIYSCRKLGVKVFELQHGISYQSTITYSGAQNYFFTPDCFLEFGDNDPKCVYGIKEDKMINIGWAFGDYVNKINSGLNITDKDILVVSEPSYSDEIVDMVVELAKANIDYYFHFRPHPLEQISAESLCKIDSVGNISIQDNTMNFSYVLNSFKYIIGFNSTALYEALSAGKIVGKLYLQRCAPLFLKEEDKSYFVKIDGSEPLFALFKDECLVPYHSIYSPYSRQKIDNLLLGKEI